MLLGCMEGWGAAVESLLPALQAQDLGHPCLQQLPRPYRWGGRLGSTTSVVSWADGNIKSTLHHSELVSSQHKPCILPVHSSGPPSHARARARTHTYTRHITDKSLGVIPPELLDANLPLPAAKGEPDSKW